MIQEWFIRFLVTFLICYWTLRLSHPVWGRPVSNWLLRRGKIKLAMSLRFRKW